MFQPAHPDDVRHARALVAQGYRPNLLQPNDILAVVSRRDDRQHVERGTWAVMHLMLLASDSAAPTKKEPPPA